MRLPVAVQEKPGLRRYHMNILANLVIEVPQPGEGDPARIADVSLPLIYFEVIKGATGLAMTPPAPG